MINVKQELIKTLVSAYELPVWAEEARQHFRPPCFFVATVNVRQRDEIQSRWRRIFSFDVQYHARDESNAELESMGAELAERLTYLPEARVHGSNISYRVVDKVLHFLVDYTIGLVQVKDYPKMRQLHEEVKLDERQRNDNGNNGSGS